MNNLTVTDTDISPLLVTRELITAHEYWRQKAEQALFRARLLGEMVELQNDLASVSCTALTVNRAESLEPVTHEMRLHRHLTS